MGRLCTLTVTLIFGAWGAATEGASPDDAAPSPATAVRKPAPVPPIKYLEAGARLFNSGKFELAAKYLDAAQMYRDQLQQDEQTTLDAYLKELSQVQASAARGSSTSGSSGNSSPAAPEAASPPSGAAAATATPAAPPVVQTGDATCGGAGELAISADPKQRGRWLLHEAREQIAQGNFDAAEQKVAEVEALDIKWGLFDDTPTKVRNVLNKERPKNDASAAKSVTTKPGDHKTAKAMLREARTALSNHQYDQAESIAQEVKGWNLSFGLFEDNPDKVAAAARALRKRDKIRTTTPREQASQGVYDVLVQESRQLVKIGKLDEAEVKAQPGSADERRPGPHRRSRRVGPPRHRDGSRRTSPGAPAATPGSEAPSVVAEREANDLLAKGDQARAAAKFSEAEKLRLKESGSGRDAQAAAASPAVDAAVQKSSGEPAGAPLLAAPGAEGAQPTDKPAAAAPDKPAAQPASPAPDKPAAQPASPAPAVRKPAPVPPIKYLEAGARLFNSGKFELAAKYLDAAQMYRDQLQQDEQTTLDAYLKELSQVQASAARGSSTSGNGSGNSSPAAPEAASPPSGAAAVTATPATPTVVQTGDATRGGAGELAISADPKQRGRWLLHEAREQIAQGNFDAAEQKVAEVEALDIKWGLFDDTPTKVRNVLNKERPKNDASAAKSVTTKPGDHKTAKAMLREARTALSNHQYDQAESIAQEVKGWNLSFGLFEDNPDKVAAAARALRKRDKIRTTTPREQASQGVYDVLVQESRQLVKIGKLDEAEVKARQAQRMNVVPALTADRAESVLHDIAMARARTSPGVPAATPGSEAPSVVAEREANDLLAKGDQARAAAKFSEAEKLRLKESGSGRDAQAAAASPAVDAAVQKSSGEPAGAPLLAAPGAEGAQPTDKPAAAAPDKPAAQPASPAPDQPARPARQSCTG